LLGHKWNSPGSKFQCQTLLIHSFQKSSAHGAIDIKHGALNAEHLVRVQHLFVCFVYFVVHMAKLYQLAERNNTRTFYPRINIRRASAAAA